jgi:DNA helicase-2/ATP-dependent DNA helicase PcrA
MPTPLPLASMGLDIYTAYQRALTYRGAVDFDDLIRLAADMLESSSELRERLRYRWPFILEDEAQDSSKVQQDILFALAGTEGNWVRVGDPNQAIFETFTTADPQLLLDFIEKHRNVEMPETGRCQPSIMGLANFLVEWTMNEHPTKEVRDALSPPFMRPTPAGDAQQNPPDDPDGVSLLAEGLTPQEEVNAVARLLEEWLPSHRDRTVAVLTSTNDHAAHMVKALQARGIEYRELLRSTSPTRAAAGALSLVLGYLADPDSSSKLAKAYRVWRRDWRDHADREPLLQLVAGVLGKLKRVEDFIAPSLRPAASVFPGNIDVAALVEGDLPESRRGALMAELQQFRQLIARWHGATVLSIDQLILTVSQDIFTSAADLALAHKLALVMGQLAAENTRWRLPELTPNLHEIARNERRFLGFSSDDAGFNPDDHKGVVVVSTMHKAKGLEWDRVYLMSVNDYDFPSAQLTDRFISEKWFIRDGLNFEAEALAQLDAVRSTADHGDYEEGAATSDARLDYARERLRLLFVGITRARRELIVTWNTGRRSEATAALPLVALQRWWQSTHT